MSKRITRHKPLSLPRPSDQQTRQQTIEERTADLRLRAAKARAEDAARIARGFDMPSRDRAAKPARSKPR